MGAKISVTVHHDADSPTDPGKKSNVTSSLDHFCTYEDLFDQIIWIIRDSVYPMESFLLKSVEVVDHSPGEFEVKIMHDARRLETFFDFEDQEKRDRLRSWYKCWHSREKREIITEEYHEDGRLEIRCNMRFLSDPLRVEFWGDHVSGARRHGKIYASLIKHVYLVPALKCLQPREVKVYRSDKSIDGFGISCISESLDEHINYAGLTMLVSDILKLPPTQIMAKFTELSDSEFEIKTLGPPRKVPKEGEPLERVVVTTYYKEDYENGQVNAVVSVGNQLVMTAWIRIHRNPLRLEYWTEEGDRRTAGRTEFMVLQDIVDTVIRKVEGLDGWFW